MKQRKKLHSTQRHGGEPGDGRLSVCVPSGDVVGRMDFGYMMVFSASLGHIEIDGCESAASCYKISQPVSVFVALKRNEFDLKQESELLRLLFR